MNYDKKKLGGALFFVLVFLLFVLKSNSKEEFQRRKFLYDYQQNFGTSSIGHVKHWTANGNEPTYEEQYQLNELYRKNREMKQRPLETKGVGINEATINSETLCNLAGYRWCNNFGINGVNKCTKNKQCSSNTGKVTELTSL